MLRMNLRPVYFPNINQLCDWLLTVNGVFRSDLGCCRAVSGSLPSIQLFTGSLFSAVLESDFGGDFNNTKWQGCPYFPVPEPHLSSSAVGLNQKPALLFTAPVWQPWEENNGVYCGAAQCSFNMLWQGARSTSDGKASGLSLRLLMTALCNRIIPTLCLSSTMTRCS